ncbi:MAG: hypothetical protein AAF962_16665 [Actinomycetota bacterium]
MTVDKRRASWLVVSTALTLALLASVIAGLQGDPGSIDASAPLSDDGGSLTIAESTATAQLLNPRSASAALLPPLENAGEVNQVADEDEGPATEATTGDGTSTTDGDTTTTADETTTTDDDDDESTTSTTTNDDDETTTSATGGTTSTSDDDESTSTTKAPAGPSTTEVDDATTTTTQPTTTEAPTPPTTPKPGTGGTYYVDCNSGSDGNNGTSTTQAVRTLTRAGNLSLGPGDSLLLKRGCTWSGGQRLDVGWRGTASNKITVGAYGSGARPRILDGKNQGVKVTGSHLIIRDLHVTFGVSETRTLNGCSVPFGDYYGVNFTDGASNVLLTDSLMEKANAGVHLSANSSSITVQGNTLQNNNVMNKWNPSSAAGDLGAWGVLIRSDNNDISYNTFSNNKAPCANGIGRIHSNSAEIYEGSNNYIHHNTSNDRVFSELGSSAAKKASDNRFAYNTHRSSIPLARFVTTRGSGEAFGPVFRTIVEHNTVWLTSGNSVAVVCGGGCGTNVLTLRNNILAAGEKALFTDQAITEGNNTYWDPVGGPVTIQYAGQNKTYDAGTAVLNGSIVADPGIG